VLKKANMLDPLYLPDLDDPAVNPFDRSPEIIHCNICYSLILLSDLYSTRPSGDHYHIECLTMKKSGECFYCCITTDLKKLFYKPCKSVLVCVKCLFKTSSDEYPDATKMMNVLPIVPPLFNIGSPLYDVGDIFNPPTKYWDLMFSSPRESLDDIDLHCYEEFPDL
jgi:hypothetical protein